MNISRRITPISDNPDITFPLLESWNPMTRVATIAAQVDKNRVLCRIPMDVLKKIFDADVNEPMRAVTENRAELQAKARFLIENKLFEEDGSVTLQLKYF